MKIIATHYIDGAFIPSHGREVMDVIRPTDGQVIAHVTLADEEDTRHAIAAAKRAFATYGRSTVDERAKLLRRLHEAVSERIDELTAAMVEEYGGVARFSRMIVESGVTAFKAAEEALQQVAWRRSWGRTTSHLGAGGRGRSNYGVECERAVHLPQTGLCGRCGLPSRHQAERTQCAANSGAA